MISKLSQEQERLVEYLACKRLYVLRDGATMVQDWVCGVKIFQSPSTKMLTPNRTT